VFPAFRLPETSALAIAGRSYSGLHPVVIPIVLELALGEKRADKQTFQVFKTWKV
jgi:hypothetical protein